MTRKQFSASALWHHLLTFEGKCADCQCKTGGANGLEWDHVTPLAMGGDDTLDNLQPLCRACHKAKTAQDKAHIGKAKRMNQRQAGIPRQTRSKIPGSKGTGFRRKINGTTERIEHD